jgi:hypothetical protein
MPMLHPVMRRDVWPVRSDGGDAGDEIDTGVEASTEPPVFLRDSGVDAPTGDASNDATDAASSDATDGGG